MKTSSPFEFPPEQTRIVKKAIRLEYLAITYIFTVIVLLYSVMGTSQAMKTAWVSDALALIPSVVFLAGYKISHRKPNQKFPYGYHRATTLAFLCASLALLSIGIYLFIDSFHKLVTQEHPTISTMKVFNLVIWQGWIMIPALVYSIVPSIVIGFKKKPYALNLNDKVLYTSSEIHRADWMSESAAILGIIGIGAGYWWADALAALVISLDVIHDGFRSMRDVVASLMNRTPKSLDPNKKFDLQNRILHTVKNFSWVKDSEVRLREEGHVYFGEVFVVPHAEQSILDNLQVLKTEIRKIDWRLHDIVIAPIKSLDQL